MRNSTRYFLGADVGATKTHILISDEAGNAAGFGEAGPGNHEAVGYDGLRWALLQAFERAAASPGISPDQIYGAGFGVAGYDWPSERKPTLEAIAALGLQAPVEAVNDANLGLLAGTAEGWGVAVVSGTGCNCRGWDRTRQKEGHVTGGGIDMGEGAGASELIFRARQAVAHEWTLRGPETKLTPAFIRHVGAEHIEDLLEGLMTGRYSIDASAAPLVFQVAEEGDTVATELVCWAGTELGELANAVIRQLELQPFEFDVVLMGGMFGGSSPLIDCMRRKIHSMAPKAKLVRLRTPPVVGAVLLGMELAGIRADQALRKRLSETVNSIRSPG
jgi:N-acetylglucosamine kinase-like BadF-type ATPase